MLEAAVLAHAFGQHLFARMTKRRMPEIMGQRDRFRQILVQASARAIVRLTEATSKVCVSRVRK